MSGGGLGPQLKRDPLGGVYPRDGNLKYFFRRLFRRRRARLALWYLAAAGSVVLVYGAGPLVQFPIAFVLPVTLAAWFDGPRHAVAFAIILPLIRLAFVLGLWAVPWNESYSVANAGIRIAVLGFLAVLTSRVAERHSAMRREAAMLERLLPICSYCKKIRNPDGSWNRLESYLKEHADIGLSHGICPDCAREHFPERAPDT